MNMDTFLLNNTNKTIKLVNRVIQSLQRLKELQISNKFQQKAESNMLLV